jgi:opacity protein-like surface antigen
VSQVAEQAPPAQIPGARITFESAGFSGDYHMNKTALFAVAASAAALFALPAAAQGLTGMYVQGNVGYSLAGQADAEFEFDVGGVTGSDSGEIDLEGGFLASGAIGAATPVGLRVEGEAIYSANDLDEDGGSVKHWAVMANGIYDFAMGGVTPYVGAGVGYGNTSVEFDDLDGFELDDSGLAWQLRAGVTFGEAVMWDIGYRYLNLADLESSMDDGTDSFSLEAEAAIHAVSVGVRFPLGG